MSGGSSFCLKNIPNTYGFCSLHEGHTDPCRTAEIESSTIRVPETPSKDWSLEVPSTDAEAIEAIKHKKTQGLYLPAIGIYQVYRKRGYTVLESYEEALRAIIGAERKSI